MEFVARPLKNEFEVKSNLMRFRNLMGRIWGSRVITILDKIKVHPIKRVIEFHIYLIND